VTILEEGQEHMLKVQRSILKNQEQILSRLAALEKRDQASAFGTPVWYTQDDYDAGDFCFESVDDSYMLPPPYIPPPPVQHHLPPPHGRRPPARSSSSSTGSPSSGSTGIPLLRLHGIPLLQLRGILTLRLCWILILLLWLHGLPTLLWLHGIPTLFPSTHLLHIHHHMFGLHFDSYTNQMPLWDRMGENHAL
jgi:hypothetical protein